VSAHSWIGLNHSAIEGATLDRVSFSDASRMFVHHSTLTGAETALHLQQSAFAGANTSLCIANSTIEGTQRGIYFEGARENERSRKYYPQVLSARATFSIRDSSLSGGSKAMDFYDSFIIDGIFYRTYSLVANSTVVIENSRLGPQMNMNVGDGFELVTFNLELAEMFARDALERNESCGGHFRDDYQTPENEALRDDENYSHVAAWEYKGNGQQMNWERHKEELDFEYVKLATRSYK
jgi:hypothetical protein